MTHNLVNPVILSGGMGTRLWPMSRVRQPKQFQPIDGADGRSFFQETVLRHTSALFEAPIVVASEAERELLFDQVSGIGAEARFIGEPVGRNTGPAVLAAALSLYARDPQALLLVLPSDHIIEGDMDAYVRAMVAPARAGHIVLFGIVPRYPETGFGYISSGAEYPEHPGLHAVEGFIEKPEAERAQQLVDQGDTFWSSGISMMRADVLIEEFARHDPETLTAVQEAVLLGSRDRDGQVLEAESFARAKDDPTERLIFEKSDRVSVVPVDVLWSDVGAWPAIHSLGEKSDDGNVETGSVVTLDTRNSLIRASDKLVAVVGMEDVIVVDTPDALLVTNHENAQKVKEAVGELKKRDRSEVLTHAEAAPASDGATDRVAEEYLAPGESLELCAEPGASLVLAVTAGCASIEGPAQAAGARQAGEHVTLAPGEALRVANDGPEPLALVRVDLCASAGSPSEKAEEPVAAQAELPGGKRSRALA
ncbi:mannose-1-phosphate guanylyltransferase [Roseivivax sp.]